MRIHAFLTVVLFLLLPHAQALVVLQYHHVSEDTPRSTSVTPERFKAHMDYLAEHNYKVLSLSQADAALRSGHALPDNAVLITFDDGYRSIFDEAFPVLQKRKWPFVVFINSQPHDEGQRSHMTWEELRELSQHGGDIANHSRHHPHMIRREKDADASQIFKEEVAYCQQRIEEEIGRAPLWFAYPFGEYDRALQKQLAEAGYLAFAQHSGPVSTGGDLQAIPRFPFGGDYGDISDFATKVKSVPMNGLTIRVTDENKKALNETALPLDVEKPVLWLTLPDALRQLNLNCFASGQGAIPVEKVGDELRVQAAKPLPVGRSRYNCTAAAGKGRFYWFSDMFIRRGADGSWQHE